MKKLSDKMATALIRGAVVLTGITCIVAITLFINSLYGFFVTMFLGTLAAILLDEHLKSLTH